MGGIQWLNEHTVLITDGMQLSGQSPASIVIDPDGPLKLNSIALLKGVRPTTYTSVMGAQTVAPTFMVLKYLN